MSSSNHISQQKLLVLLSMTLIALFCISLTVGSNPFSLFQAASEAMADTPSVISLILTDLCKILIDCGRYHWASTKDLLRNKFMIWMPQRLP
jgi:hypothetical protein